MSLTDVREGLAAGRLDGVVRAAEPMARHTSYRIGGPAALFVEADSVSDLTCVLDICVEHEVPAVIVGKGSNLLVADSGYEGVVVVLGREFKRHSVDGDIIKTGAGVILAHVVQDAYSRGLSGLEFAVGVPGTVGGALVMNAGARDDWIEQIVESVTLFEQGRGLYSLRRDEIEWGYRSTDLPQRGVVVECTLRLTPGDSASIRRTMDESLARRKVTQPLGVPSAGSVFANPTGDSAGRLVESVGLKGAREGDAQISDVHANFIVNRGRASASDVVALMRRAQHAVRDRYGIELRPEIRFLGSFSEA